MIELFDVQTEIGIEAPGEREVVTVEKITVELERLEIGGALVRCLLPEHLDVDLMALNARLYAACASHAALTPCPLVSPNGGSDLPSETEQVAEAIANGAAAVWIRPTSDNWRLESWACDPLFHALQERCLPVFCLQHMVNVPEVADLAGRYPELPFILAGVGYRQQRVLIPLLRAFPNIFLSLGNAFTVHRGIEQMVEVIGEERLLFGTGFPESEPMAAVTQLIYAEITDEQKASIGTGNLHRLREGIRV